MRRPGNSWSICQIGIPIPGTISRARSLISLYTRASRAGKDEAAPEVLSREVLNRFSTKDCYYTKTCLDEALDLMAVCVK